MVPFPCFLVSIHIHTQWPLFEGIPGWSMCLLDQWPHYLSFKIWSSQSSNLQSSENGYSGPSISSKVVLFLRNMKKRKWKKVFILWRELLGFENDGWMSQSGWPCPNCVHVVRLEGLFHPVQGGAHLLSCNTELFLILLYCLLNAVFLLWGGMGKERAMVSEFERRIFYSKLSVLGWII